MHHDPFQFLGAHPTPKGGSTTIRAYLPMAKAVTVLTGAKATPMKRADRRGLFTASVRGAVAPGYSFRIEYLDGVIEEVMDPYSFPPVLSEFDLYLMGEGTHYRKYEKLGAHAIALEGVEGVSFAVWAPNAKGASVVGDFNLWDGRRHQMRQRGGGIWELFIPGLGVGRMYKYELRTEMGVLTKTDPYGLYAEVRPGTASIVWDLDGYEWGDAQWMNERRERDWLGSPIAAYEVHLGSWARQPGGGFMNYRDLAHMLVEYVARMGYTHIELMPLLEHPLDASWGYQTVGYFAVTSRFGTPEDFMYFVDHCHEHGIGVIMDWVPAHFPKDAHGLACFDGSFLYEHSHPFQREHRDWGTHIFNYGRTEVASFLLNSALFWLHRYHIDGLRVDAVASMIYLDYSREEGQWIPNRYGGNENLEAIAFVKRFNELCHSEHPGVLTIAEESTAWPMVSRPTYAGGLGFSLKWNMGWMHDTLLYFSHEPIHRKYHHYSLSFGLVYAFHENFMLVFSHDEVVHGKRAMLDKMPGDLWQKFANMRLLFAFMYAHPGKKLMFMGAEIGQWAEWNFDWQLDWHLLEYEPHQKLQSFLQDLNHLIKREPALYERDFEPAGFEWIDFQDADASVVSFIRRAKDREDFLVVVMNATPVVREGYRVGVPRGGMYREIMNSDSEAYWGSNVGNAGLVMADPVAYNLHQHSLNLTLPPLGLLIFKPER